MSVFSPVTSSPPSQWAESCCPVAHSEWEDPRPKLRVPISIPAKTSRNSSNPKMRRPSTHPRVIDAPSRSPAVMRGGGQCHVHVTKPECAGKSGRDGPEGTPRHVGPSAQTARVWGPRMLQAGDHYKASTGGGSPFPQNLRASGAPGGVLGGPVSQCLGF